MPPFQGLGLGGGYHTASPLASPDIWFPFRESVFCLEWDDVYRWDLVHWFRDHPCHFL